MNSNSFGESFSRLVQENSVYYMLGFNTAEDRDDGRYVPVQVRVKLPRLKVLARDGYIAPFKARITSRHPNGRRGSELRWRARSLSEV